MNIILSAILMAAIIYLLPVIGVLLLIFFGILFQVLWEPMKVANNIWCTIIDYIKKHISKKREDKDISNLEL